MAYFLLSEPDLDAVAGGADYYTDISISQNSRGGDAVAVGGYSGSAIAGTAAATASGNVNVSAVGGAGGTNTITITGPL
jgi:hypothetical protein